MSTTIHPPAVTDRQRALLARLLHQGRVTMQQLLDAEVGRMSRPELAAWLEAHVFGSQPDEQTLRAVDELFAWHSKSATPKGAAA
jgi:hypothetical protein